MSEVQIKIATKEDIPSLMDLRKEFLFKEFEKSIDEVGKEFYEATRLYFEQSLTDGTQVSCLVYLDGRLAGCGMLCFEHLLPTLDHPTGRRGHLMNIYIRREYRRNGLGSRMLDVLVSEGRNRGLTEISLDATEDGEKLYESYGFLHNQSAMALTLTYPSPDA